MISVGKFITKDVNSKKESDPLKENKFEEKLVSDHVTESIESTESSNQVSLRNLTLSPIFWQLSNLYLCLMKRNSEKLIEPIIENLIESSTNINKEYWIDSSHALFIFGECAKLNMRVLNALLLISNNNFQTNDLNRSERSSIVNNKEDNSLIDFKKNGIETWSWELGHAYVCFF